MTLPGQFSDPRVITLVGLLAVTAATWVVLGLHRARARRECSRAPLERVWHPQETIELTADEERAFGQVVSHLSLGSAGRIR
ncbi:hypothetical protein [Streptomyces sp. NPDC048623]|uniref:hypothetical protein n=1 Tax=Streptomyces sp. NPDC048623 TaxID=3155761 RepID=UPI00343EA22D